MIGVSSEKKGEDPKNLKRKPANVVMKYMQDFGYKVIPVNPFAEGEVINGEKVVASLDKISEKIDIVDVFRPSKDSFVRSSLDRAFGRSDIGERVDVAAANLDARACVTHEARLPSRSHPSIRCDSNPSPCQPACTRVGV